MKKNVLILLFILFSFSGIFAQEVTFYGIDFSHVKVYAAKDSETAFADVFNRINMLMISESEKYDFSKVVGAKVYHNIEPVIAINNEADYKDLFIYGDRVDELPVEKIVQEYELSEKEGTGLVIIAQLLNKAASTANHYVVLFDIATRQIKFSELVTAKAGGFGLRNFWANTIYHIVKKVRLRS